MVNSGEIQGLNDALSRYSKIRIADYQRNYDWSRSEIEDLWRDIKSTIETGKDHFFGSLILQKLDHSLCEVVDGQQRLTTVFLFAARLRDEIRKLDVSAIPATTPNERAINVLSSVEDFIYGKDERKAIPRYDANVLLHSLAKSIFSQTDDPKADRDVPRRSRAEDRQATLPFRNAYHLVKELIDVELEGSHGSLEKLVQIHKLSSALLDKLKVLPITTDSSDESLNVFMTTNDRGLPLGVFDLTRGQVLKALTLELDETKKKKVFVETLQDWEDILTNVEGSKPDQFLRHHLLSDRLEKITMKMVPAVTEKIIDMSRGGFQERASQLWDGIKISSEIYDQLLRPVAKSPTKERLECLLLLADSYRLMALRVFHPDSNLNPKQQEDLTRLLFVSVIKWVMANKNAQEFETELQRAAQPLWGGGGYEESREILKSIINDFQVDIRGYLQEGVSAVTSKALLLAIEAELSGQAAPLDFSSLHLEHIAPQKDTPEWLVAMNSTSRTYKELVEDIGNATILDSGLNLKIKQSAFPVKKESYSKSRSNITNDLAKVHDWNAETVESRRMWVADCLEKMLRTNPEKIDHFSHWLSTGA